MARFESRGIVAKVSADSCIILTSQGTYHKIPRPSQEIRVGAEIAYPSPRLSSPFKPLLMAAAIILMLVGYPLGQQLLQPQPAAFVSLDIDPSLEIAVDKQLQVIAVKGFDSGADELIASIDLRGYGLNRAVAAVIDQAVDRDMISAGRDIKMISTISLEDTASRTVDQQSLYKVMEDTMAARGLNGEVKIYTVNRDFHLAASQKDLSAGRFLIYQQLLRSGQAVSVDEVKTQSVSQLAALYQVALLPNYGQIMIQTAQGDQDVITVDENGRSAALEEYLTSIGTNPAAEDMDAHQRDTGVSRSYSARQNRISAMETSSGIAASPGV